MGAVYLAMRARGYWGSAVLADTNVGVREFWRMIHREPHKLLRAAEALRPALTPDDYRQLAADTPRDPHDAVARFLWLTNYAYGNTPPVWREGPKWQSVSGTKLTSSDTRNQTFPWSDCLERLRELAERLPLFSEQTHVVESWRTAAKLSHANTMNYLDPPYRDTDPTNYGDMPPDLMEVVRAFKGEFVVSESSEMAFPSWWSVRVCMVAGRQSHGTGRQDKRVERLYWSF